MDPSIAQVQLRKTDGEISGPKLFTFDGVYYVSDTTQQIYKEICFPLVEGVLQGYNGTVHVCLWSDWVWEELFDDGGD